MRIYKNPGSETPDRELKKSCIKQTPQSVDQWNFKREYPTLDPKYPNIFGACGELLPEIVSFLSFSDTLLTFCFQSRFYFIEINKYNEIRIFLQGVEDVRIVYEKDKNNDELGGA